MTPDWQDFVIQYGISARADHLGFILGRDTKEISRLREKGVCKPLDGSAPKAFAELYSLWNGRAPSDADWPAPRRFGSGKVFEWLGPEIVLLGSLVGRLDKAEIAEILTARLREVTGDPTARRSLMAVQVQINRIGLISTDVVGGVTVSAAGLEIGSRTVVYDAIRNKRLRTLRVGRLWVIPHEQWAQFKAERVFPPDGYIQLARLREKLGIRSDKLSEYARMGYIPTAVRCNPCGNGVRSTQFGTWYIDPVAARQIVADRLAGRPMPWHGKPMMDNLGVTWKKLQKRKHPDSCATCHQIWGAAGAPNSFEDFQVRYPGLMLGAKRHLTLKWSPGLNLNEIAEETGRNSHQIRRAIANGQMVSVRHGRQHLVSRTDVTRWKARHCPTGDGEHSWVSIDTAIKRYGFTRKEIESLIASGELNSLLKTKGPQRGVLVVARQQCTDYRRKHGFSEADAARRVGVTVKHLRVLLKGLQWRTSGDIPIEVIRAAQLRNESAYGYTVQAAAAKLEKPLAWVRKQIESGVISVRTVKWDTRRRYITLPMYKRLKYAAQNPVRRESLTQLWLPLNGAAMHAGVSAATLVRWVEEGEVKRRGTPKGYRYHKGNITDRARRYWQTVRYKRAVPPVWLQASADSGTPTARSDSMSI